MYARVIFSFFIMKFIPRFNLVTSDVILFVCRWNSSHCQFTFINLLMYSESNQSNGKISRWFSIMRYVAIINFVTQNAYKISYLNAQFLPVVYKNKTQNNCIYLKEKQLFQYICIGLRFFDLILFQAHSESFVHFSYWFYLIVIDFYK